MALRVEAFIGPPAPAAHFHAPTDTKQCQHIKATLLANDVLAADAAFVADNGGLACGQTIVMAVQHSYPDSMLREFHRHVGSMERAHTEYMEHLAWEAAARTGRLRTGRGEDRQTSAIVLPVEVWCDRTSRPTGYDPSMYELPYYHEMLQAIETTRLRFPLTVAALDRASRPAYHGTLAEIVPAQAYSTLTQSIRRQLRAVDALCEAVSGDTMGGTLGAEMRRILASDPTSDHHIAKMIDSGAFLVARTAVDAMIGVYPVGALVAATIRQFRSGVQDDSTSALLSAISRIQMRRDGKLCILGAIAGIGNVLATASQREDWGSDAEVIYRKLLAVMVSNPTIPGDDQWATEWRLMATNLAQDVRIQKGTPTRHVFTKEDVHILCDRWRALGYAQEKGLAAANAIRRHSEDDTGDVAFVAHGENQALQRVISKLKTMILASTTYERQTVRRARRVAPGPAKPSPPIGTCTDDPPEAPTVAMSAFRSIKGPAGTRRSQARARRARTWGSKAHGAAPSGARTAAGPLGVAPASQTKGGGLPVPPAAESAKPILAPASTTPDRADADRPVAGAPAPQTLGGGSPAPAVAATAKPTRTAKQTPAPQTLGGGLPVPLAEAAATPTLAESSTMSARANPDRPVGRAGHYRPGPGHVKESPMACWVTPATAPRSGTTEETPVPVAASTQASAPPPGTASQTDAAKGRSELNRMYERAREEVFRRLHSRARKDIWTAEAKKACRKQQRIAACAVRTAWSEMEGARVTEITPEADPVRLSRPDNRPAWMTDAAHAPRAQGGIGATPVTDRGDKQPDHAQSPRAPVSAGGGKKAQITKAPPQPDQAASGTGGSATGMGARHPDPTDSGDGPPPPGSARIAPASPSPETRSGQEGEGAAR